MYYLSTRWFGVFLHDGKKILDHILFPKKVSSLKGRIEKIRNGEVLEEERRLAKGKDVLSSDKRLIYITRYSENIPYIEIKPEDFMFSYKDLRKALIRISKEKISKEMSKEDLQIIQMIKDMNELVKMSNVLSERIREWKDLTVQDGIEIVEELKKEVDRSLEEIKTKIEKKMKILAPNLSALLGPIIGAELISLAGGLEKLAKLPASSIQIIGAEKALFRYKHGKGTPPKHGIIFRHQLIRSAKPKQRGRLSRFLASKVSIAVRADAFTGNIICNELKKDIDEFLSKLNSKK